MTLNLLLIVRSIQSVRCVGVMRLDDNSLNRQKQSAVRMGWTQKGRVVVTKVILNLKGGKLNFEFKFQCKFIYNLT